MAEQVTFGFSVAPTVPMAILEAASSPAAAYREHIRQSEEIIRDLKLPFTSIWVEDHLEWDEHPTAETWTLLTYLAGRHPGFLYGNIVLSQSYRNPALTAKMSAIMQILTEGKFILGIGAGWKQDEYEAYGYDFPPASTRIEQLEDAIQIIQMMLKQSPASYSGQHYRITNAHNDPQPDHPTTLLIGGGGQKKTLRVVAKYADWWNVPSISSEDYARKQEALRQHCAEVGRDFAAIKQTYYGLLQVVDDPAQTRKMDGLHAQTGTAQEIAADIQRFIDLGVSHFMFRIVGYPHWDSYTRFVNDVLPRLRY